MANPEESKNTGRGRLAFDGTLASLLVLILGGLYCWDSQNYPQVTSGQKSRDLLTTNVPAPEPSDMSGDDRNSDVSAKPEVSEPVATHEVKPGDEVKVAGSAPPIPVDRSPPRASVSGGYKLELPKPPEPEPAPVIVERLLTQKNLNQFGNPEGEGYGLARPNEFAGARMLVWSTEPEATSNVFTDDNPLWAAIKDLGFEIQMKRTRFEPRWLREVDQLWVFSGRLSGMDAASFAAVVDFIQQGNGVYLAAENDPFFVEAAELTRRLYQTDISGDFAGQNIIAVRGHGITRDDFRRLGKDAVPVGKQDTRIDIINRCTHYAEEHPLLTDVNFVFEGHTISHIDPTTRLQTVLKAYDTQILAAVSLDPGQRVVVDCGWTRYFFSSRGHLVTETAGTIRYAENIAAYLMGKDDKHQGIGHWQDRKKLLEKYRDMRPDDLEAALKSNDPSERLAAVTTVVRRRLAIPDALIELVRDPERDVRSQARAALRGLAGGVDYGPAESANRDECELCYQRWSSWLRRKRMLDTFQARPQEVVVAAMTSDDPEERWSAVSAAVSRRFDIPDTLINLLADPEPEICQLARMALAKLARTDFGPQPNADQAATNEAILEWKRWRVLKKFPDLRNATSDALIAAMKVDNAEHRWAAVITVRQKKLRLVPSLINLLNDPEKLVRQESRRALVQIAKGTDHGPSDDATDPEVAQSTQQWTEWWQNELEKSAQQKLQLAKQRFRDDALAGRRRLEEVVEQFPGTKSAKEAELLLMRR